MQQVIRSTDGLGFFQSHAFQGSQKNENYVQDGDPRACNPLRLVRPARPAARVGPWSALVLGRLPDEVFTGASAISSERLRCGVPAALVLTVVDWLTFASNIARDVAWPTVVICVGLLFRKQLSGALERLKSLLDDRVTEASITRQGVTIQRRVEVEAGLENARKELTAASANEALVVEAVEDNTSPFIQEARDLASINPAASVAASASRLELALRSVLEERNPSARRMGLGQLIREATNQQVLSKDEAAAARYLVEVRNEAIHEGVASVGQAEEFAALALRVAIAARFESGQFSIEGTDPL